jgi:hypothetical protein
VRKFVHAARRYSCSSPPGLHLLQGTWIAFYRTCGFQLTTARTQRRCERRAGRRLCPVCHQDGR